VTLVRALRPCTAALVGASFLVSGAAAATAQRAADAPPEATGFAVSNGGAPYAGDRRLLATISPNGDGLRDGALVRFRLSKPATVQFVIRETRPDTVVAYKTTESRRAGWTSFAWTPPPTVEPRTYIVTVTLRDRRGRRRTYGPRYASDPQTTPVIRVRGVDAGFLSQSYSPESSARLWVASDAKALTIQFFRALRQGRISHDEMSGVPVSGTVTIPWTRWRNAPRPVRVWIGAWPSGVYYAKLVADDGRVGYAPVIVRPRRLGEHRIAVVMPTNTWQAYNFQDVDGDGFGDTWYAAWNRHTVRLDRPYQNHGVPRHFREYDLSFLTWLVRQDKPVDVLAESDLAAAGSGDVLARLYDAIVFPGHTEYVTQPEFDVVERFRDLGGNLAFLSANNFYWKVVRRGAVIERTARWRSLGRPEAGLIGVQYVGNDRGQRKGKYLVLSTAEAPWLFEGTGLVDGSTFGTYGIEIDATAASSPAGTDVLAEVPDLFGPGLSAQMTYYETASGAKVFAAGAFTFGGAALLKPETNLLANLWDRLSQP
jgi:hypothetical protein